MFFRAFSFRGNLFARSAEILENPTLSWRGRMETPRFPDLWKHWRTTPFDAAELGICLEFGRLPGGRHAIWVRHFCTFGVCGVCDCAKWFFSGGFFSGGFFSGEFFPGEFFSGGFFSGRRQNLGFAWHLEGFQEEGTRFG